MSLVVVEPGSSLAEPGTWLGELLSIHVAPVRRTPTRSVESVVVVVGARRPGGGGRLLTGG